MIALVLLLSLVSGYGQQICRVQPYIERPQFDLPEYVRPLHERPQFERPNLIRPVFILPTIIPPKIEEPKFEDAEFIWCPTTNGIPAEASAKMMLMHALYSKGRYQPNMESAKSIIKELRTTPALIAEHTAKEVEEGTCCGDAAPVAAQTVSTVEEAMAIAAKNRTSSVSPANNGHRPDLTRLGVTVRERPAGYTADAPVAVRTLQP